MSFKDERNNEIKFLLLLFHVEVTLSALAVNELNRVVRAGTFMNLFAKVMITGGYLFVLSSSAESVAAIYGPFAALRSKNTNRSI